MSGTVTVILHVQQKLSYRAHDVVMMTKTNLFQLVHTQKGNARSV